MSHIAFGAIVAWIFTGLFAMVTTVSPGAINAVVGCGLVAVVLTVTYLFA